MSYRQMVVEVLLKNPSCKRETVDRDGFNCLYYATYYGNLEIVKILKEIEVPYIGSSNGTTPLHVAVRKNHFDLVHFFLSRTKEMEMQTSKKKSKTMGQDEIAQMNRFNRYRIWEQNIDVDEQKTKNGVSAAFIAVKNNNT